MKILISWICANLGIIDAYLVFLTSVVNLLSHNWKLRNRYIFCIQRLQTLAIKLGSFEICSLVEIEIKIAKAADQIQILIMLADMSTFFNTSRSFIKVRWRDWIKLASRELFLLGDFLAAKGN